MSLNPGREAIGAAALNAQAFAGLNPALQKQAMALVRASNGKVYLKSGYRTPEQQQAAYAEAGNRYGPDNANKVVADPQVSNHVQGQAVDFGGDLQVMNQLRPQFGLAAPMGWEPWHFEFPSVTQSSHPAAYTIAPNGEPNPTQRTDHTPASMAASIAESLLALQHRDTMGLGMSAQSIDDTGSTGGTTDTGSIDAGSYTPGGGAFGGVQQQQWATDFLKTLGKPITSENVKAVTAWEAAESGGGGGHFNPLNTTQGGFAGESNLNSVGVKNFRTYNDGIAANVKVINNGRYQPILDALDAGDNAMTVAEAIAKTPWGTGSGAARVLAGGG